MRILLIAVLLILCASCATELEPLDYGAIINYKVNSIAERYKDNPVVMASVKVVLADGMITSHELKQLERIDFLEYMKASRMIVAREIVARNPDSTRLAEIFKVFCEDTVITGLELQYLAHIENEESYKVKDDEKTKTISGP